MKALNNSETMKLHRTTGGRSKSINSSMTKDSCTASSIRSTLISTNLITNGRGGIHYSI